MRISFSEFIEDYYPGVPKADIRSFMVVHLGSDYRGTAGWVNRYIHYQTHETSSKSIVHQTSKRWRNNRWVLLSDIASEAHGALYWKQSECRMTFHCSDWFRQCRKVWAPGSFSWNIAEHKARIVPPGHCLMVCQIVCMICTLWQFMG